MVALAHVEAPRIRNVARIGEIDRVFRAHVTAAEGRLLKRNAVLMTPGDVDESPAIGAEQPFVGREDHKIRIESFDVHVRTPALCVASTRRTALCRRSASPTLFRSISPPS